ncbi:trichohyalin-like [Notolabrus celidotus]|uniref:trichohyalin-like n=1 Tax=Notolabrus celidotus TaxID=1203425 RepID=UPI0014907CBB|nr:trichohyalin-like [Notolabrus celidotus]
MDNKRNSESLSRAETMEKETEAEVMLNKITELQHLVESKDKQLMDERLKADIKLQKKMVASHNLQTSLDEAKQERDEMAERLRRKEQEDMRRENDTDVQLEDLKNQLQAERLRSDTLQKEQEEFRKEVKEKSRRDLKQVWDLEKEKVTLDCIIASQDIKLKNKMVSSRYLQTSLDEAKQERDEMAERLRRKEQEDMRRENNTDVQLEDLKNQLQTERMRSDTLQKEQEQFMQERPPGGQERASRDLKQVQNLEVKGLSVEAKALQLKNMKIKELEELIAREQHQQKNKVMTRYLQTSLEEAKQERDEMVRVMRKDQVHLSRKTNTDVQRENLDLDCKLASSRALQEDMIKELQEFVESKENQLQAERLRADTLLNELDELRLEVQQKASRDLKQVQNLEEEKRSLDSIIASQDFKLHNKMVLSRNLQTSLDEAEQERDEMAERLRRKEQELEDLRRKTNTDVQLEDLKNQLQAERLRADTLQKQQEEFRQERPPGGQERASRDLKQVQNLEVKVLSQEQVAKALHIKEIKIKELEELTAKEQHQQKNKVLTRYLQTSLEEAKQEQDEMAQRLNRKDQEHLRRETNTDVQLEDLKNQLQAERLRSDTLQKEQEDFRLEVQEKASRDLKQVQDLEEEKRSLEQEVKALQIKHDYRIQELQQLGASQDTQLQDQVKVNQAIQEEMKDLQGEVAIIALQDNKIKELHDLVESLRNQLQAVRLRTDTIRKEQEELRREAQRRASRDQKWVQNLEEEKVSLEQALQKEVSRRVSEERNNTNRIQELQDLAASSKNQLQTERLEVQDRLIEMENVSLWRRFKKAITPDSRRQYKHLRMQWQDQEENPSSSVPPSPPNMPRP